MGIPISSSEAFTWLHPPVFRATPLDVKAEANQHFLQGVNQLVCHGWPYSPPEAGEPGWSFYVATVFNDHNPWWPVMPELTRYLTRCSDLLRQGRPADDVAVYLPNDDAWAQFTPGHASLTDALGERLGHDLVGRILDGGYNLDFFDDRLLAARGSVDGDALAFGDLRYRVVVLPGVERIPPATLATLERFVHGGGTLIATRSVPSRAPGHLATAQDQQAVTDGVARLFRGDHPRARLVRDERDLPAALAERLAPDVTLDPPNAAVGFVHRVTPTADIYFLANTSNQPVHARVRFRAAHRSAERWDPTTGTALALSMVGDRYPLDLEPYDAAFVLLDDADPPAPHAVVPAATANVDWSDGWSLRFPGEAAPVALGRVHPWTDDPARRSFSGVAVYGRHVSVDPALLSEGRRLTLDFGQGTPRPARPVERGNPGFAAELDPPVAEAAVVYVNDRRAGTVWCPPYALDVSGLLHAGDNALRVEVANTAVNGLAGGRFPNYDVAGLTAKFGKRFDPAKAEAFRPATSGLAGPIVLRVAR